MMMGREEVVVTDAVEAVSSPGLVRLDRSVWTRPLSFECYFAIAIKSASFTIVIFCSRTNDIFAGISSRVRTSHLLVKSQQGGTICRHYFVKQAQYSRNQCINGSNHNDFARLI